MKIILYRKYILVIYLICAFSIVDLSGQHGIFLDEKFDDWEGISALAEEVNDETGGKSGIDRVFITNDDHFLYIRIQISKSITIQDEEKISLNIDIDDKLTTGFKTNGIGSELNYQFGSRIGILNALDGRDTTIKHNNIGLIFSPVRSSNDFEIAIKRKNNFGTFSYEMGNAISVFFENRSNFADKLPNEGKGGVKYSMKTNTNPYIRSFSLDKIDDNHVRIFTYNSLEDGLFDPLRSGHQIKLIKAANPDIIAFQELYNSTVADINNVLNTNLPLGNGKTWNVKRHASFQDLVIASKYNIEDSEQVGEEAAFLLKNPTNNQQFIVINCHLSCCSQNEMRQDQIDNINNFIRKIKAQNSGLAAPVNTPVIITGDMNLVGSEQNYQSLLKGDIINNTLYGQDIKPDWDNSNLEDVIANVPYLNSNYTWYSEGNGYTPGRLDFIVYTGSKIKEENSFVLETAHLPEDLLSQYDIESNAARLASDHLPVVSDFSFELNVSPLSYTSQEEGAICDGNIVYKINSISGGRPPYTIKVNNGSFDEITSPFPLSLPLITGDNFIYLKDSYDSILTINKNIDQNITFRIDGFAINGGEIAIITSNANVPLLYKYDKGDWTSSSSFVPMTKDSITIFVADNSLLCIKEIKIWPAIDADKDGYDWFVDCEDALPAINPGAIEIANNDLDENCDGKIEIIDIDGDGYNSGVDCNDSAAAINPGVQEIVNNDVDENCDGKIEIIDVDGDGYNSSVDCNDNAIAINPGAAEIVNNDVDENCDGKVEIIDVDGDGFNSSVDCNDNDASINPNAVEIPDNTIDENCDGIIITKVSDLNEMGIRIFPIPFSENLTIEDDALLVSKAELYDEAGKRIRPMTGNHMNTKDLVTGFYLLKIYTKSKVYWVKVVKY